MDMRFDRVVTDELLRLLTETQARQLIDLARTQDGGPPLYDLQLRRNQPQPGRAETTTHRECWATLYYGLTKLVDLHEREGRAKITSASYDHLAEFDDDWSSWQDPGLLLRQWPRVAKFLDELTTDGHVGASALSKEGPVHAGLSSGNSDAFRVINREANPAFASAPVRKKRLAGWVAPFNEALGGFPERESWWPTDVRVGAALDHLAVDIAGRLLIIEAKAGNASAGEIAKVAVQAGAYAAMYADMLNEDADLVPRLRTMLQQRVDLKLVPSGRLHLRDQTRVVPVVALGYPAPSAEVQRRMWAVARAVTSAVDRERVDELEVWFLDHLGRIARVERGADVAPAPT